MRVEAKLKGAERRAHLALREMELFKIADPFEHEDDATTVKEWAAIRASRRLNTQLMRYDAAFHPDPETFVSWALRAGACPYLVHLGYDDDYDTITAERMLENFRASRELFVAGRALSAVKLLALVRKTRKLRVAAKLPVD